MKPHFQSFLAPSFLAPSFLTALAITVAFVGSANAYTVDLRDDGPDYEYGDINGTCANGDTFTVRYQTDSSGRLYFADLENQGRDEDTVIRQECGE